MSSTSLFQKKKPENYNICCAGDIILSHDLTQCLLVLTKKGLSFTKGGIEKISFTNSFGKIEQRLETVEENAERETNQESGITRDKRLVLVDGKTHKPIYFDEVKRDGVIGVRYLATVIKPDLDITKIEITFDQKELLSSKWYLVEDILDNSDLYHKRKAILHDAIYILKNNPLLIPAETLQSFMAEKNPIETKTIDNIVNNDLKTTVATNPYSYASVLSRNLNTTTVPNVNIIQNTNSSSSSSSSYVFNKNMVSISKALSTILRHQAVNLNLIVEPDGFVDLNSIFKIKEQILEYNESIKLSGKPIANIKQIPDYVEKLEGVTKLDVEYIVKTNDKKRFELKTVDDKIYIRAVQGHSDKLKKVIVDDKLLTKIIHPLPICIHGTTRPYWNAIKLFGLNRMSRIHIHMIPSKPNDKNKIISGLKHKSDTLIYINMEHAMQDGMVFYTSSNNVVLSSGFDGIIPPKYLTATDLHGKKID